MEFEKYIRASLLHVRDCVFRNREHLQDIATENTLHRVEVDLGKVLALHLLGGVVDQAVDSSVPDTPNSSSIPRPDTFQIRFLVGV